ncbi:MAG: signal peptidase I [Candidatus Coatesbacteria bacterium]|nr:MAG: signal peptidase I [Candidatus Coatesbacteria bacterium]
MEAPDGTLDEREVEARTGNKAKRAKTVLREYAEAIAVAILLAFFIRAFVIQAFVVPSGSMKDTLLVGDYVVVNKFIYRFTSPSRGDVVVFKHPLQDNEITVGKWVKETFELVVYRRRVVRHDYVKRVVGVPGDIVMGRGGSVYVNGEPLADGQGKGGVGEFGPYKVPEDSYFVLGDNRDASRDSRDWGYVPRRLIKGKALIVYWSRIPGECPEHRSSVALPDADEGAYVCEGGGETLRDYEDVRAAPWYAFWKRIRWSRLGRIIR